MKKLPNIVVATILAGMSGVFAIATVGLTLIDEKWSFWLGVLLSMAGIGLAAAASPFIVKSDAKTTRERQLKIAAPVIVAVAGVAIILRWFIHIGQKVIPGKCFGVGLSGGGCFGIRMPV
jgi:cation transport ATPase